MEKIGYLGPEGSYSYIAAEQMRPEAKLLAYSSFPLVMASLTSGETDAIVLPIENSVNGGVLQNIDLLQCTEGVCAVEERIVKIDHRLVTKAGADISGIKRIYSHSQALGQCAAYLAKNFPSAKLISAESTAASLDMVKTAEDACIAGAHTHREGLVLSQNNIADEDSNLTHFLLVRRGEIQQGTHSNKIYFSVTCANKSGALLSLLHCISKRGLNMTKIESRPIKNAPDEYRFFIETEGDYSQNTVKLALEDIKNTANSFKLLGCY